MRLSRFWVLLLISAFAFAGTSCSYYNKVMARKNLVDGSKAYKDRKFADAEKLFRYAASLDPQGTTLEGRTAQLSLARTLHSMYIGDRQKKDLAEKALEEYQKSLPQTLNDLKDVSAEYQKNKASEDNQRKYFTAVSAANSTTSAIGSLLDSLQRNDEARAWQAKVAADETMPATARARALSSMASKSNSCANEITDTPETKKTVTKDGKPAFQFTKPADAAKFAELKQCVADGMKYVDQAAALEPEEVKNAGSLDVKKASDITLSLNSEILKVFESARSYKASLTVQAMRIAEMDGNTADKDKFKAESDQYKTKFTELSDVVKKIQAEIDERVAAKEAAANPTAAKANNTNAAK